MAQETSTPTLLQKELESVDIDRSQSIRRAHSNHGSLLFPLSHVKIKLADESGMIIRELNRSILSSKEGGCEAAVDDYSEAE